MLANSTFLGQQKMTCRTPALFPCSVILGSQCEIVRVVVFNGGNDGLYKLQEHYEVQVDPQLASSFKHCFTYLLHGLGMSRDEIRRKSQHKDGVNKIRKEEVKKRKRMKMGKERQN